MLVVLALILTMVPALAAPAGDRGDPERNRFLATVLSIEAIGSRELVLLQADEKPRFAVTVRVDGFPAGRDSGPFHRGAEVSFAVESPSRLFRRAPAEIKGTQLLFDFAGRLEVLAPGPRSKLTPAREYTPAPVAAREPVSLDWMAADVVYTAKPALRPRPTPGVDGWRSVVAVIGRFGKARDDDIFGNGVLLEGAPAGKARALTCAHLVERSRERAAQVRVGLFDHSLVAGERGVPRYMEAVADVVALDAAADLALLQFDCTLALQTTRTLSDDEQSVRTLTYCGMDAVSIVPFGEPTAVRTAPARLEPGQSGTPGFSDGKVARMAQGFHPEMCSFSGGVWADPGEIRAFLRTAEALPTCPPART